jgi:hypothetical protein
MKSRTRFLLISSLASTLADAAHQACCSVSDRYHLPRFVLHFSSRPLRMPEPTWKTYSPALLPTFLAIWMASYERRGEFGLVDPNQVRSDIAEELVSTLVGDLAHSDSIYAGLETANEVDRQLTRAQVDAVLGQSGQAATFSDKITWIEDTIGQVQQHADSAQTAVSTQAAIKQMAQQNARQSEILGAVQSELLQSRQDAQLTNLNLANMSQNLDQEARARRLQSLGNALDTLQISAQARLF